jgi:hypothetical protein
MNRFEDKIDRITDRIASIDKTLGEQAVELKEHIRRTDLLEKKVEKSEEFINRQMGAVKLLMIIISIVAACETVVHYLK